MQTIFFRAICFGAPVGPWRRHREQAQRDLLNECLGGYDEWGTFYITVPGDIESRREHAQSKAA